MGRAIVEDVKKHPFATAARGLEAGAYVFALFDPPTTGPALYGLYATFGVTAADFGATVTREGQK